MKMPMEWHRQCLANQRQSFRDHLRRLEQAQASVQRALKDLAFYEEQIREAEKNELNGFDCTRFMVRKRR
jgi:hypothetical protein